MLKSWNTEDQRPRTKEAANMGDENERSVGSAGSRREPVAWAVMLPDGDRIYDVYAIEEEAKAIDEAVTGNHGVVPLYRPPTLTDEERKALEYFWTFCDENVVPEIWIQHGASLRGLAERTK
jgi:hypothetical protein